MVAAAVAIWPMQHGLVLQPHHFHFDMHLQPLSSSHQGTALSTTGLVNERGVSNISGARQRQPMSTMPVLNENTSGTITNPDINRSRLSTDSGHDSPGFDHSFL